MQFFFHNALQCSIEVFSWKTALNFESGNEIPYRSVLLGRQILTGILTLQGGTTVRVYSMKILLLYII